MCWDFVTRMRRELWLRLVGFLGISQECHAAVGRRMDGWGQGRGCVSNHVVSYMRLRDWLVLCLWWLNNSYTDCETRMHHGKNFTSDASCGTEKSRCASDYHVSNIILVGLKCRSRNIIFCTFAFELALLMKVFVDLCWDYETGMRRELWIRLVRWPLWPAEWVYYYQVFNTVMVIAK